MLKELVTRIKAAPLRGKRRLVAVAGAPASGKSTLADALAGADRSFRMVPMDGFHLDNRILRTRDLLHRKGAPETFDVAGLWHLVGRLAREDEVIYPTFDRSLDRAIAGAGVVGPAVATVILEGNYLLLDRPGWRDLARKWDLSIRLDVPAETLETRLMQRWLDHGYSTEEAAGKVHQNDMLNANAVMGDALAADIVLTPEDMMLT